MLCLPFRRLRVEQPELLVAGLTGPSIRREALSMVARRQRPASPAIAHRDAGVAMHRGPARQRSEC